MKLCYDFDIEDLTAFQRYHYSNSPAYRRKRNVNRVLFPIAASLLVTSRFLRHGFDPIYLGIFAVLAVAWFVLYPRWFDRKVIRRSNQFLREGKTDGMFGRREIEFFLDKVHIVSPSGETTYRSSAITKIVETPDALLLYVSSVPALILPRRKLSESDFQQAARFVRQHYATQAA